MRANGEANRPSAGELSAIRLRLMIVGLMLVAVVVPVSIALAPHLHGSRMLWKLCLIVPLPLFGVFAFVFARRSLRR